MLFLYFFYTKLLINFKESKVDVDVLDVRDVVHGHEDDDENDEYEKEDELRGADLGPLILQPPVVDEAVGGVYFVDLEGRGEAGLALDRRQFTRTAGGQTNKVRELLIE